MSYYYQWGDPEKKSLRRSLASIGKTTKTSNGRVVFIPVAEDNRDYQEYLEWVAEGNIADAADTPPTPTLDQQWASVRADRDSRLAETDWTQTPDVPQETIWKWKTYRQDLRDIPQKQTDPNNITWPTKPS